MGIFQKKIFLHLLILKMSKYHSPMWRNGRNFTQKNEKTTKSRKSGKNAKNGFRYVSNPSNFDLNSKFQAALMFNG